MDVLFLQEVSTSFRDFFHRSRLCKGFTCVMRENARDQRLAAENR